MSEGGGLTRFLKRRRTVSPYFLWLPSGESSNAWSRRETAGVGCKRELERAARRRRRLEAPVMQE